MTNPSIASDLIERLRRGSLEYVDGHPVAYGPPFNPDGPEAAEVIEQLTREVDELRAAGGNALAAIKAARDMVPDEEEGLAAQIFAYHLNMADVRLAEALSRSSGRVSDATK